jgi:DNA-binding HxlR family transcriptional regulator
MGALKGYGQFCAVARALDALGDRWALLVVRELLFGPRRYTDLLTGLPGIGSSVLAARLRELEEANLITRSRLAPPAASTVYELSGDGAALRPVIDALARWGLRLMDSPREGEAVRGVWLAYTIAVSVPAAVLPEGAELELRIDGEPHSFVVRGGRLENRLAAADRPIAIVETGARSLFLVVTDQADAGDLVSRGEIVIRGDENLAQGFLDAAQGVWRRTR